MWIILNLLRRVARLYSFNTKICVYDIFIINSLLSSSFSHNSKFQQNNFLLSIIYFSSVETTAPKREIINLWKMENIKLIMSNADTYLRELIDSVYIIETNSTSEASQGQCFSSCFALLFPHNSLARTRKPHHNNISSQGRSMRAHMSVRFSIHTNCSIVRIVWCSAHWLIMHTRSGSIFGSSHIFRYWKKELFCIIFEFCLCIQFGSFRAGYDINLSIIANVLAWVITIPLRRKSGVCVRGVWILFYFIKVKRFICDDFSMYIAISRKMSICEHQ